MARILPSTCPPPYLFKGRYMGQVVAFIKAHQIYDHFTEPGTAESPSVDIIHSDHNFRIMGERLWTPSDMDLAALKNLPVGHIQKFEAEKILKKVHNLIAHQGPREPDAFLPRKDSAEPSCLRNPVAVSAAHRHGNPCRHRVERRPDFLAVSYAPSDPESPLGGSRPPRERNRSKKTRS